MIQGEAHRQAGSGAHSGPAPAVREPGCEAARPVLLVVDDNPVVVAWTQAQLRKRFGSLGYRVEGAGSVRAAVDLLRIRKEPHYVLLDVNMPTTSGVEALRAILPWASVAKVITYSAMDPAEWRERMLAAGAEAYVQKTADAEAFARAIGAELPDAAGQAAAPGCGAGSAD